LIRTVVENWLRDELQHRGYDLVFTPHIMLFDLWKTSGHANFYKENMFGAVEVEKADYQLKPMNCPGHILIYKSKLRSYRDLPVRLAELGHRVSLRAQWRATTALACPRIHPGRRPHFLHAFTDRVRSRSMHGFCLRRHEEFGFDKFEVELSDWDPKHPENYPESQRIGNTLQMLSPG